MTTLSPSTTNSDKLSRGWIMLALLSVGIAITATVPYFTFNRDYFAPIFDGRFLNNPHWIYIHAGFAGLALLLGPFQFVNQIRTRWPEVHRWMGRVYIFSIFAGGLSGLVIAVGSPAGLSGTVGFSLLAIVWMYTAAQAVLAIRSGRVQEHKRWMIYNFALTFAAVTLRLQLGLGMFVQIGLLGIPEETAFLEIYRTVPWSCWVPNLLVAQLMIDRYKRNE